MRALLAASGFIAALELSAADWSQREGYRIRSVTPSEPGHDARARPLLQENGHGRFRAVPAMESGIELYGEGRACRAGDFDSDGKIDLVVLERNGAVHKFHNNR